MKPPARPGGDVVGEQPLTLGPAGEVGVGHLADEPTGLLLYQVEVDVAGGVGRARRAGWQDWASQAAW